MKRFWIAALVAGVLGLVGASAYAYTCYTNCYYVGNQRVCNTNCY
jgi:hypothetical protein